MGDSALPEGAARRIVIIQGHPDKSRAHLCHALADAYADGASSAGYEIRRIEVPDIEFPLLQSTEEFYKAQAPKSIEGVQGDIRWSNHLLIVYPLWLGTMPALLKGFFEQTFRPGFGVTDEGKGMPRGLLKGRSARVVVTMGMPSFVYRWYFRAHSLKNLKRNILKFCGIKPVSVSLFGLVESVSDEKREQWKNKMKNLGGQGK